ncbi:MAG: hypothetical protein ACFFCZ_21635, partial [Promethearchaeota archaeon]
MGKTKRRQKRGYPLGLMIGFETQKVFFWFIYSERAELHKIHKMPRKLENMEKRHHYQFYEDIVNELRPILKRGMKSILLITPLKKNYALGFLDHIKCHHQWMLNEKHPNFTSFRFLTGNISNLEQTTSLIQSTEFKEALGQVNKEEAEQIVRLLEKRLNSADEGLVFHTLKEIEDLIYAGGKRKKKFKPLPLNPEYIVLTNQYLDEHPNKNRLQQLLQIANNRRIRIKVIDSETKAGRRVT